MILICLFQASKNTQNLKNPNIVVGNGAIELIYNFCSAFISKNSKVLIPIPTFQEYESASKLLNNASLTFFKSMNLSQDLDSFISKNSKKRICVYL